MIEKRKEPRANISFPVACDILPKRRYFYTVCKDLSGEGVRIITNDFLSKGQAVKLNINLIKAVVTVKAEVIWCNKQRYSNYHAGLKFMEIDERGKRSLKLLVSSLMKNNQ